MSLTTLANLVVRFSSTGAAGVASSTRDISKAAQGTTLVVTTLTDKMGKMSTTMKEVQKISVSTSTSVSEMSRSMGGTLAVIGAVITALGSMAVVTKELIDEAVKWEQLELGLVAIEGSAGKASSALTELVKIAKLPGLTLESSIKAYQGFRSLDIGAERAQHTIKALSNTIALAGGGDVQFLRVVKQFEQMVGKGKVLQQDMRVIQESMPNITMAMAKAFGTVDLAKIREQMGATEFISKLVAEMDKMPRAADTAKNALENLGTAWSQFKGSIMDTSVIKNSANAMTTWLEKATAILKHDPNAIRKIVGGAISQMGAGLPGMAVGAAIGYAQTDKPERPREEVLTEGRQKAWQDWVNALRMIEVAEASGQKKTIEGWKNASNEAHKRFLTMDADLKAEIKARQDATAAKVKLEADETAAAIKRERDAAAQAEADKERETQKKRSAEQVIADAKRAAEAEIKYQQEVAMNVAKLSAESDALIKKEHDDRIEAFNKAKAEELAGDRERVKALQGTLATETERIVQEYNERLNFLRSTSEIEAGLRQDLEKRAQADRDKKLEDIKKQHASELQAVKDYLATEDEQIKAAYAQRRATVIRETTEGSEERNKLIKQLDQNLMVQQMEMWTQRSSAIASAESQLFAALAESAQMAQGEHSKLYRTMFATSKAFAIADSTVQILNGIAKASNTPWPANIAAIASTTAATAGLISQINSVAGAFDKGGMIPAGKMGLVGELGPELVQGPAIVTSRAQTMSKINGGQAPSITVHNYGGVDVQTKTSGINGQDIELIIRKVTAATENSIATGITRGSGKVASAIEKTYPVRRGA